jgi:single-stranded-DNA-specific exonuclease
VGVAFKLCCELIRRNQKKISIDSLLKIAAIGTIADVAPLIGENRTIAWLGLRGLANVRNAGLRALLQRIGIYGRPLRASDIGFKVGPRINAAGRLASANTAIDLFSSPDDETARNVCAELDRMNTERQAIERAVRDEAEKQLAELVAKSRGHGVTPSNLETSRSRDPFPRVLILAGESWHRGVVGLTAGRIAQRYNRPALVISIDGDQCVGSARSIPSINLHAQLERVADLFTHFGGHEFACGFALPLTAIDDLRTRLAEAFESIDEEAFVRTASIDAELVLSDIDREFVSVYEGLEPFGAGNPQPLFVARGLRVESSRTFAEDCCELMLGDGTRRVPAVLWPPVKQLAEEMATAGRADVLFHVEADGYSSTGARMNVVDARKAE